MQNLVPRCSGSRWYVGRSGRYTDIASGIFGLNQNEYEIEATFQYEI